MSQFALTCPKDENLTLNSALNYPKWNAYVSMMLTAHGGGLDSYFARGDMLISPDDELALPLKAALDNTLQVVLMNTVSTKILMKYQSENVFGLTLLQAIRNDYSNVSPRQLYNMVCKAVDAAMNKTVSDDSSLVLLRAICSHFNQSPKISQMMGLFLLKMFRSDQAVQKAYVLIYISLFKIVGRFVQLFLS